MKLIITTCCFLFIGALTISAQSQEAEYTYDRAGRLTGVYYEGGTSITYVYDAAGNLLRRRTSVIEDDDNDRMDDTFEDVNFETRDRDGSGDFDQDGQSDLAEFYAGTDPKDPDSLLTVIASSLEEGGATITWNAVDGERYRVQYKDNGFNSHAWYDLAGDVTATGDSASKTDPDALLPVNRFYRVILLK